LLALASAALGNASQLADSFADWRDHPAISYNAGATHDPVAELTARMASGEALLTADVVSGYLPSLLRALDVPVESQVLVFSQTSLQRSRITRENPRAVFFNDSVAVAWVRGGFIEIAAQSPRHAVVFYSLDGGPAGPRITRRHDCLNCHFSHRTVGVPGMLAPSDHTRPLEQRWGGWYVTGRHGDLQHLGNEDIMVWPRPAAAYNWPSLEGRFDTTGYPAVHSDIAALLVFDHQMRMMNLLSRVNWETRVTGRPTDAAIAEVVDYMLFAGEAPLKAAIRGSSGFSVAFAARGPHDARGRSLRDLDFGTRLMRYPLSYMIYSAQFDALPESVRAGIYERLWAVLSGADAGARYSYLSAADRRAILEILRETKQGLPAFFG
jgi:hypothetical protein